MSSSPGYEKEKEREHGKDRDREDEARNNNESEVCSKEVKEEEKEFVDGDDKCYNCGGSGHFARECVSSKGSAKIDIAPTCHHCKGRGHFARICPSIQRTRLKESCYICGLPGHRRYECQLFIAATNAGYGRGGRGGPVRREAGRGMPSPYGYGGYPPGPYGFNPLAYMMPAAYGYPPMLGGGGGGGGGRGRGGPRDNGPPICYNCQQPGHFARDCPQNRS